MRLYSLCLGGIFNIEDLSESWLIMSDDHCLMPRTCQLFYHEKRKSNLKLEPKMKKNSNPSENCFGRSFRDMLRSNLASNLN